MKIRVGLIIAWLIITSFMTYLAGIEIFLFPYYLWAMTGGNEGYIVIVIGYLIMIGWFSSFIYLCYGVITNKED